MRPRNLPQERDRVRARNKNERERARGREGGREREGERERDLHEDRVTQSVSADRRIGDSFEVGPHSPIRLLKE